MHLYKYQSFNVNSIASLVNRYSWFSSPSDLNDALDLSLIDSPFLHSINYSREKIYCLSAKHDNMLMWSHYADSHKGFCLEFADYTDAEIDTMKKQGLYPKEAANDTLAIIRNAKPIEYKTIEEINTYIKDIPLTESALKTHYVSQQSLGLGDAFIAKIHQSSFIKHENWAYEEEYRIINIEKNIVNQPGKITGVYFGAKMPAVHKRTIGMIACPEGTSDCRLYQMHRPSGTPFLQSRPFDKRIDLAGLEVHY